MKIGVDLGGTKVKAGVEKNGSIVQQNTIMLQQKDSLSATLEQLIDLIRPLANYPVKSIGIGVPSVVDTKRGIVYNVTHIPSWEKVALRDILEEEFNLPVYVNNDVNCFTLGEHLFGVAKDFESVVGMALGTGLGSGIIIDNRLFVGNNCGAGEIGMLPYLDHNFEYYVCSHFFSVIHGTSALEASRAALSGDKKAMGLWEEFGQHLGAAIKAVLYIYDPEAIVLGGLSLKHFPSLKQGCWKPLVILPTPNHSSV